MDESSELREVLALCRASGTDTQRCEVKGAVGGLPKDAVETLSAFANGSGGVLILGVSEEEGFHPAQGFDAKRIQDALANLCNEKLVPALRPDIEIVSCDGAPVVMAVVEELPPFDKPCYVKARGLYDGSFIRTGDGDRKLTHYEINRLLEERRQPRHDILVVEEAEASDLDTELASKLLARERALHPAVFGKFDDEDALVGLRALAPDGQGALRPTVAGLMALGTFPQKYFPRLNVSFAFYPGTKKAEVSESGQRFLDASEIIGPIPVMVAEAVAAVQRNMRTGAVIEGAFRRDVPDYPLEAVREAVANALMHRDYSPEAWGTQIQVNMFADRLEVFNPGGLYGAVTVETLGTLGVSSSRNEFLSRLLASTPYPRPLGEAQYVVENKGTGYLEIERKLAANGMEPPDPEDRPGYFTLTMHRNEGKRARAASEDALTEPVRSILELARKNGSISAREAQEATKLSRATVVKRINELVKEGRLTPTGPAKSRTRRYEYVE
ncbi:ATP-binding protein [Arabiibacter massiliensis]|uniref:ATP-binding protein n=1 Tax=Arabiibacter massiliensis TaxID=1870985 RepID=UPI0009B9650B|nr:ATP-binding protein [Arabiibacter massiliensis]